ncbi:MAG TPA: MFS transporter [Acetobacteraceae bacterium]|jgi:MFS family permease|nr:MFS transporter [Acetobacteraceae bacterium]
MPDLGVTPPRAASIEARASWTAACLTLAILSISYGSPLLVVVGLKPIQEALGTDRSVVALAGALVWVGTGLGGIMMGWLADRIGIRLTATIGAVMMALGLAISSLGSVWALYVGHGLLIGLVGNGAIYAPLVVYVTRWFDRRRGSALAFISSGQYIAGVVWPSVFQRGITTIGWQTTMLAYAVVVVVVILPLTLLCLRPAPEPLAPHPLSGDPRKGETVLGLNANLALALICIAAFFCCIPMAVPNGHLVAFCTDLGIVPTHGAAMLSVLLACAFISRQFWGMLADRVGGLRAVMVGSACQAVAVAGFLLTQNEIGLFAVSAAFGLGFSGIIPSYVVAIRQLFPSSEASWRVPTFFFLGMSGMAFGSWLAGALYDHFGFYAPAFAVGVFFNLANLVVIGLLVARQRSQSRLMPAYG